MTDELRKALQTGWHPLISGHGEMKKLASELEQNVNELINEGAKQISINWKNIPDRQFNPDETHGFFRIIGNKPK